MQNQNLLNVVIILGAIVGLTIGIRGLLNKETENVYKAINWLIFGIVMAIFLIFRIYCQSLEHKISNDFLESLNFWGIVAMLFSTGIYGVINKTKIDDPVSFTFSRGAVIISIIYIVGMFFFWLRWHHL